MEQVIKNISISAKILKLVREGKDIRQAFDAVIGSGAYEKLAGEVYDELRSKAVETNKQGE